MERPSMGHGISFQDEQLCPALFPGQSGLDRSFSGSGHSSPGMACRHAMPEGEGFTPLA